jgi:enamine deaminase RidA (YjgF/YER057c/UK114 family)
MSRARGLHQALVRAMDETHQAIILLRVVCGCFGDDGTPSDTVGEADLASCTLHALTHLETASEALGDAESLEKDPQKNEQLNVLLRRFWRATDVVIVTGTVLQQDELPNGRGMTACPVQGALMMAVATLEEVLDEIGRYILTVPHDIEPEAATALTEEAQPA